MLTILKFMKTFFYIILFILALILIRDFIIGQKGSKYLQNCIQYTDSSIEACQQSTRVLFYNKILLLKSK